MAHEMDTGPLHLTLGVGCAKITLVTVSGEEQEQVEHRSKSEETQDLENLGNHVKQICSIRLGKRDTA